MHEHEPIEIEEGATYERRDLKAGPIWKSIFWFFVGTALTILICIPILNVLEWGTTRVSGDPSFREERSLRVPEGMVLQNNVTARQDMFDLGKQFREQTETYGWIDQGRGIARVPVARAMSAFVEAGQRATAPAEVPEPADASETEGEEQDGISTDDGDGGEPVSE